MRRVSLDNEPRLSRLESLKDPYLLPEKREELMRLAWEWLKTGKFGRPELERLMHFAWAAGYAEAEINHTQDPC